jgi:guanylate kinase
MPSPLIGNLKNGLIFVLSAPAGTGKTTLVSMLTHEFSNIVASVSYTTRQPRAGEQEGVHYHFITETEFARREIEGEFLEHVELYGNRYGTSKAWIDGRLAQGQHVFLVIDTQGALFLKDKLEAVYIFVQPPSFEELERRLQARKTEPSEEMNRRLQQAKKEMEIGMTYDYSIVNDSLEIAYQVLRSIVIAEEHRIR